MRAAGTFGQITATVQRHGYRSWHYAGVVGGGPRVIQGALRWNSDFRKTGLSSGATGLTACRAEAVRAVEIGAVPWAVPPP